jgi:hypothetical protein
MDAVRAPDVLLQPAHLLEVLDRAAPEEPVAVLLLLECLGEVGVEPQAEAPRELGGLPHQPLRDRERRAGRHDDLRPRAGAGLVEGEETFRVGKHLVGILDEVVRRQAAVGLAHVHRAARGDEPDAELARSLDLRLDEPFPAGREDVVVIESGRATAEGKGGETGTGCGVLGIAVDPAPKWIELAEPAEKVGLLRPRPREGLVEVVVSVDEPGVTSAPPRFSNASAGGGLPSPTSTRKPSSTRIQPLESSVPASSIVTTYAFANRVRM